MKLRLHQYDSLLELSRSPNLYKGSYELFLKEVILNLSKKLNVSRVSFWLYDTKEDAIINQMLYDQKTNEFTTRGILERSNYPNYFSAFETSLLINVEDAQTDPRTKEFAQTYLIPNKIVSMLDVQVCIDGKFFGVICLEQTHFQRSWKQDEEFYVSSVASYVAQSYAIKLQKEEEKKRKLSEANYKNLFNDSPYPMWVYDHETLKFLAVNKCAIKQYGYSEDEFLSMTIADIRPKDQQDKLRNYLNETGHIRWISTNWVHQYKNGDIVYVDIASDWTVYNERKARIVIALNKTEEQRLQEEREKYFNKLRDFAFYASHNLRGPIASLLGLNNVLKVDWDNRESYEKVIRRMQDTVKKLDEVIRILNSKVDIE